MDLNENSYAASNDPSAQSKLTMAREVIDRIDKGDLVGRQRVVIDRLSTIRVGKKKILNHLQILKNKEESGEYSNRALVGKLIESYDGLMVQEKEFIALMRDIIKSYHEAIDLVTSELNSIQHPQPTAMELTENIVEECDEEHKKLENTVNVQLDGLVHGFTSLENMVTEMEKTSLMDEQFKICIELHYEQKKKMELMHEIHMKEKASLEMSTKELADHAKHRVVNERSSLDRKQKQLERLRREAERRGLLVEGHTLRQKSDVGTQQNAKKKRQQQKHSQQETIDSVEPIIAENERIPSLPSLPVFTPTENSSGKKRDELRTKISERFASIETRKQRMRLIRMKLNGLETEKMNNAYDEAVKRVHCLDEMRKKLDDLKVGMEKDEAFCERGTDEEKTHIEAKEDEEKNAREGGELEGNLAEGSHSNERLSDDENECSRSSVATDELIKQVRQTFNTTMKNFSNDKLLPDSFPAVRFENAILALTDRLKVVEDTLSSQSDQLAWIGNKGPSSSLTPPVEVSRENIEQTAKNDAERIISILSHFLSGELTQDKVELLDDEVSSKLIQIIVTESSLLCPAEFDEKMHQNFTTIFGGLVSGFLGKNLSEMGEELIDQLRETVYNELLFLHLMRIANAVTSVGLAEDDSK